MNETGAVAIDDLAAFDEERYAAVDLNRLSVYAIGWLRDASLPASYENIVVVLFRYFPSKFSLRGYPLPDSNRVNRALLQLGPKWRNWARGSLKTGYALTPLGEATLLEVRDRLHGDQPRAPRRTSVRPPATWDPGSDLDELRATGAFERFRRDGPSSLTTDDVWDALSAYPYTPERAVRSRLITLARAAKDSGDVTVVEFVNALRGLFEAAVRSSKSPGRHRA